MRLIISLALIFLATTQSFTQSININNATRFKDGIYSSYQDFVNNDPSHPIESFQVKWKQTPFFNILKMKSCKNYKEGKIKKTNMKEVWGVCVDGVPYIQYSVGVPYKLHFGNQAADLNGNSSFSRIRIIGNICHFNIEDVYPKRTKNIFRNDSFINDVDGQMIRAQRLLKLNTGEVYHYDEFVLTQLIKNDELLAMEYKNEIDREYKIFIYLQRYNDRNPIANTGILAKQ